MQARRYLSVFLFSLASGASNAAWAHPEYRVTVVGPPNSAATDINRSGVVVGNYPVSATATHAFLNRGKGLVDLGALRGTSSNAVAINDKGKVLGHWITAAGEQRGFIYASGAARDIGTIPGRHTFYTDINNAGYITAYGALLNTFEGAHGFLRSPAGAFRDIGSLPFDNPITLALALNNCNQITGASSPVFSPEQPFRAIVWANGVIRDLGDLGTEPNYGQAINDHGQITGSASLLGGLHDRSAFLYSNGRMSNIDGRPATFSTDSEGTGINNRGHIVGTSNHLSGFVYRGKRMQSLNALIDTRLGWDIRAPEAINDAGQIAATAYRKGIQYAVRLDLIRPLAEPAPDLKLDKEAMVQDNSEEDPAAQAREIVRPVNQ